MGRVAWTRTLVEREEPLLPQRLREDVHGPFLCQCASPASATLTRTPHGRRATHKHSRCSIGDGGGSGSGEHNICAAHVCGHVEEKLSMPLRWESEQLSMKCGLKIDN